MRFASTLPASSPYSSSSCLLQRTFQSDPGGWGSSSSGPAQRQPVQSCLQMPWLCLWLVVYLSNVGFLSLSQLRDQKTDEGKEKRQGGRGEKMLAYSRSSSGLSNPHSEAAPLCSWMVCNSSDSEGRSLKVLSSRPGASREKRRTRWGRGVAASGSAVLAEIQGWWGPSAPLESVTAGFCEMQPLFWFASASPGPAQKQQGSSMGLGLHGTQLTRAAQRVLLTRTCPSLLQLTF